MTPFQVTKDTCEICKAEGLLLLTVKGFQNLWAQKLGEAEQYRFLYCENCGAALNLDYVSIDFSSGAYSNHTISLDTDTRELNLAYTIKHLSDDVFCPAAPQRLFVEFGSGSRLGLLNTLANLSDSGIYYAIDPLYLNNSTASSRQKTINLLDSFDKLVFPMDCSTSLICRNSLEYLTPMEAKTIFSNAFTNGGLLALELTELDYLAHGFSSTYTEYRSFYSSKSIQLLLKQCGYHALPIETRFIHGDGRHFCLMQIRTAEQSKRLQTFPEMSQLVSHLLSHKHSGSAPPILFGLGGRSVMAAHNELHGLINFFYDSDPSRSSTQFMGGLHSTELDAIDATTPIVVLNSRFIADAHNLFPANPIIALS